MKQFSFSLFAPKKREGEDNGGDNLTSETTASFVTVKVTASIINEDNVTYRLGDTFQTTPERAAALAHVAELVS